MAMDLKMLQAAKKFIKLQQEATENRKREVEYYEKEALKRIGQLLTRTNLNIDVYYNDDEDKTITFYIRTDENIEKNMAYKLLKQLELWGCLEQFLDENFMKLESSNNANRSGYYKINWNCRKYFDANANNSYETDDSYDEYRSSDEVVRTIGIM